MDISSLAGVDPIIIVIYVVVLIATGGVGVAIVQAITASRRGIKGDALVKEQNSIEGFTNLTAGQATFITNLQNQITALEAQIAAMRTEFQAQLGSVRDELTAEMGYSNTLIRTLSEHTIPIPPRPKR